MRVSPPITPFDNVTSARVARAGGGFSLLELLVVLVIIGVLLALLMPAYNLAKVRTQRTMCSFQMQHLTLAWQQFSDDNNGDLVDNQPLLAAGMPNDNSWFPGSARLDHDAMYGPAPFYTATNQSLVRRSKLYAYLNKADVFRCPADKRSLHGQPVVRSVSLNCWMNGQTMGDPSGHISRANDDRDFDHLLKFRFYRKQNHIMSPADMFVFIEEAESTLTDSMFSVVKDLPAMRDLADLPAARHGATAVVTYADGHTGVFRVNVRTRFVTMTSVSPSDRLADQDFEQVGEIATERLR